MNPKIVSTILFLGIVFAAGGRIRAETIAGYQSDFAQDTPADGWKYLWNAEGEIGMASAYKPLVWNGTTGGYATEADKYPVEGGGSCAILRSNSGHPGPAAAQQKKAADRYVIAAFTLPKGKSGKLTIADSSVKRTLKSTDNEKEPGGKLELRVYLNDTLQHKQIVDANDDGASFDVKVGSVKPGDIVYVAVGPGEIDSWDTFDLDFSLNLVP